jgi:hypothetical protein
MKNIFEGKKVIEYGIDDIFQNKAGNNFIIKNIANDGLSRVKKVVIIRWLGSGEEERYKKDVFDKNIRNGLFKK